jgi:murein DD-endopeptidase MepM/ murein hydrolase activator NlpD
MDLYRDDSEPLAAVDDPRAYPRDSASGLRIALGVAAALMVMAAGAAYVAFSIGKATSEAALARAAAGVERTVDGPDAAAPPPLREDASVAPSEPNAPMLASETAAPALSVAAADTIEWRVAPRLKPTLSEKAPAPLADVETAQASDSGPSLQGKAMALGQPFLATAQDRPPSALYLQDAIADRIAPPPLSIVYARDFGSGPRSVSVALQRGETFVDALRRAGVRIEDRNAAAAVFGAHQNMRLLRPGQRLALTVAEPNETLFQSAGAASAEREHLLALEFRPAPGQRLILKRSRDGGFVAEKKTAPLTTRTVSIAGVINGSLYQSAKRVGAPDEVIAQLSNVFAYDVDFQREIIGGDEFEALFEVRYDETGAVVSASDVLYARLKWKNRTKEKGYYRFVSADGTPEYFDRSGESAKRLLMKTPIDGARLSSGFGSRRHPILGYHKQHKGVDFAAPTGTPIKAAGDGVVERAGPFSTFGNYVKIKHNSGYKTAYAHLSRFAKGMKAGRRVRQGEVIGYVGTTGRSTGPHLHYEVHYKDKPVNPQNLKVATGVELFGADLKRFKASRDAIDAMRLPSPQRSGLLAQDERKRASL